MTRMRILVALALALVGAVAGVVAMPTASAQDSGDEQVLRIGWHQDPKTLNPFVGLDEESFTVWAINYDLLVGFDPEDLSPTAGIAKSWDVSEDRKTVTFKLDPKGKWSDGKPITSADVKWSLDVLGDNGVLFTNYTSNVTRIDAYAGCTSTWPGTGDAARSAARAWTARAAASSISSANVTSSARSLAASIRGIPGLRPEG